MVSDAMDLNAYDVVVVGGGLLGAGIVRDAAQRGLSAALFEQNDFGAGAAAQGSRLALGGLHALGTLDFAAVREDIREREILRQTAPHLVRPQSCLLPFYSHGLLVQARLRAGLALTDALGFDQALRVHQLLSAREARKRVPGLSPGGLLGAAVVWEAAIPEIERLTSELARDARRYGAALHPHTRVEELCREPGRPGRERVGGVRWKNNLTGETGETKAALVILAAGPEAAALAGQSPGGPLCTKTVSLIGPILPGLKDVLVIPQEDTPSLLLAVPRPDGCWLGSLSVDCHDGLGAAYDSIHYASGAEAAVLTAAVQAALPELRVSTLRRAQAAVHAPVLPGQEVRDPASESGGCDSLVVASGAGVTRFRRVAEDAVDLACRKLGRSLSVPPCRTASTPLPETHPPLRDSVPEAVEYAVAEEDCRTLRDFLERRAPQSWHAEDRRANLPVALDTLSQQLGWDKERRTAEVKAWEAEIALGQAFRVL